MSDELQLFANIISTIGFPIGAWILMWKYMTVSMKEFTTVMSNNTDMLSILATKIDSLHAINLANLKQTERINSKNDESK